ncbi:hypothetical protein EDEG_02537, partial [Edhazardia aedis USNM 41457]
IFYNDFLQSTNMKSILKDYKALNISFTNLIQNLPFLNAKQLNNLFNLVTLIKDIDFDAIIKLTRSNDRNLRNISTNVCLYYAKYLLGKGKNRKAKFKRTGSFDLKTNKSVLEYCNRINNNNNKVLDHKIEEEEEVDVLIKKTKGTNSKVPKKNILELDDNENIDANQEIKRTYSKSLSEKKSEHSKVQLINAKNNTIEILSKNKNDEYLDLIEKIYEEVFLLRYRDIDPSIRSICISYLTEYINLSVLFQENQYLKYIIWGINDKSDQVKRSCIKGLLKILKNNEITNSCKKRIIGNFKMLLDSLLYVCFNDSFKSNCIILLLELFEHDIIEFNSIFDITFDDTIKNIANDANISNVNNKNVFDTNVCNKVFELFDIVDENNAKKILNFMESKFGWLNAIILLYKKCKNILGSLKLSEEEVKTLINAYFEKKNYSQCSNSNDLNLEYSIKNSNNNLEHSNIYPTDDKQTTRRIKRIKSIKIQRKNANNDDGNELNDYINIRIKTDSDKNTKVTNGSTLLYKNLEESIYGCKPEHINDSPKRNILEPINNYINKINTNINVKPSVQIFENSSTLKNLSIEEFTELLSLIITKDHNLIHELTKIIYCYKENIKVLNNLVNSFVKMSEEFFTIENEGILDILYEKTLFIENYFVLLKKLELIFDSKVNLILTEFKEKIKNYHYDNMLNNIETIEILL